MSSHRLSTSIIYLFLRIGVLIFLFPLFFELYKENGFTGDFGSGFLSVILIIVYLGLIIVFFIMTDKTFELIGFSFTLVASLYRMLTLFAEEGIIYDHSFLLLITIVSAYFINRSLGRRQRKTGQAW